MNLGLPWLTCRTECWLTGDGNDPGRLVLQQGVEEEDWNQPINILTSYNRRGANGC